MRYYHLLFTKVFLCLLFFLSTSFKLTAQLESRWWFFGEAAGLDFSSGTAVSDTSNIIKYGFGGASTQSDSKGNLLFYYGHDTLVNGLHQPMMNGTGLLSDQLAEQSTVSVPRPNNEGQFYVFTVDAANAFNGMLQENGFFYHLVDMSLDNGLGAVVDTVKNMVLMDDSTSEKISATLHANGIDYWVMIQQSGTNLFHAYLVTENGPSAVPVTSQVGTVASNYGLCSGPMRFNHAGNMMACTKNNTLEIFDFDAATGQLSNPKILPNQLVGPGLEFSADDTKLYTGSPTQYDVTLPTAADIEASQVILAYGRTYGLQYALDGRIYGISWFGAPTGYMSVINNPNEAGLACGFQDSAVYLDGRIGYEALPLFMSHLFKTNFSADSVCVGSAASFKINFHFIDSVQWNFGDPASGAANTSTLVNPTHTYNAAGNYTVTLIAQNGVKSDTVIKTITVKEAPQIDLGPDRDLCITNPDSVKLSLGGQRGVYNWSTGSVDSLVYVSTNQFTLSAAEVLSVLLHFENECGADTDTVSIYGSEPLSVNLGDDTVLCADEFLVNPEIDTLTPIVQLLWQDSSSAGSYLQLSESELENSHNIRLTATNACGSASDSVLLTFLSVPDGILPNDSIHCLDEGFYLVRPNRKGISYEWDDQTTDFQRFVSGTGTYSLTSYNQCDTLRDTFNVVFNGEPKAEFIDDTLVCPNETVVIRNLLHQIGQMYLWSNGSTDSVLVLLPDSNGSTIISVRITLRQCSILDSIFLQLRGDCYDGCTPSFANIFTPNADGQNDQFSSGLDCQTENYHLSIFNRWGTLVFESNHQNFAWDGSVNGIPASNGVYYYVLSYKPAGQAQREYRGYVELVE